MGTVVNGNIWSGACVAGKEITGLVKNGVVFYKREIPTPSIYKRRIMVGDNLYQVKISSDYPENFYEVFPNNPIQEILINTSGGDMSFQTTVLNYSYGSLVISSFGDRLKDWYESSSENVTTYGNQETIFGNSIPVSERNNYNVTEIVNNENSNSYLAQAYRHLFIEDPNIRPVQVGDIIVSNTKFYFNVPDDFRSELPSIYTPGINDIIMLNKNGLVQKMRINYALNIYDECSIEYMKKSSDGISWDGNTGATIFDLEQEKNLSIALAGDMDLLEASGFVGTVTEINTTSPAYKYIMVDTTTLGA